jgi:hypothetical protein
MGKHREQKHTSETFHHLRHGQRPQLNSEENGFIKFAIIVANGIPN